MNLKVCACACVRACACPIPTGLTTGAVCVYPSRVADAVKTLKAANSGLPVASGETLLGSGGETDKSVIHQREEHQRPH